MRHLRSLKSSLALVVASLLASLTAIAPVYAQAPKAPAAQESVLSPDVAAVFTRMGKTLQAKEFSFRSHTTRAYTGETVNCCTSRTRQKLSFIVRIA